MLLDHRPFWAWAAYSAVSRVVGGLLVVGVVWAFVLTVGEATTGLTAALALARDVLINALDGLVLALFSATVVVRVLPSADRARFVRNTVLVAGLRGLLVGLPAALLWLEPGTNYASSTGRDHTLPLLALALMIGIAQWRAIRHYAKAWWYVAASMGAQLFGMLLDRVTQYWLLGRGIDSVLNVVLRLACAAAIAFLVALPTGAALLAIARASSHRRVGA